VDELRTQLVACLAQHRVMEADLAELEASASKLREALSLSEKSREQVVEQLRGTEERLSRREEELQGAARGMSRLEERMTRFWESVTRNDGFRLVHASVLEELSTHRERLIEAERRLANENVARYALQDAIVVIEAKAAAASREVERERALRVAQDEEKTLLEGELRQLRE
jgi:hypothetical protein